MTEKETKQLLSTIVEVYPAFGKDRNPKFTLNLWQTLFQKVVFEDAKKALLFFIATDTKRFAPAPGMLLNIISNAVQRKEMSGAEAWEHAKKAASRSLYFSGEEFRKLPPAIQAVVRSPDTLHQWASMDEWSLQHSVEPWFLRAYEDQLERECRLRLLPGEG